MSLARRVTRLEEVASERELQREARRLAAEHGLDVDELMAEEDAAGLTGEEALRTWAVEHGLDVDEVLKLAEEAEAL